MTKPKFKRRLKWILTRVLILSVFLVFFISYNLRMMEIEDRYGDLQEMYWKSENGDIVFNKLNSSSAVIEKDWRRMYVKINGKLINVDDWLDPNNKYIFDVVIYRPDKSLNGLNTDKREIERGIKNSGLELISELKVKY